MIHALHVAPLADLIDTPYVQNQAVEEGKGGKNRKRPRGRQSDGVVAKVEQRRGDGAQDDRKLEPREKGPLGGKVDLGLDADGDVDTC